MPDKPESTPDESSEEGYEAPAVSEVGSVEDVTLAPGGPGGGPGGPGGGGPRPGGPGPGQPPNGPGWDASR